VLETSFTVLLALAFLSLAGLGGRVVYRLLTGGEG
jgi:hypothetical protein